MGDEKVRVWYVMYVRHCAKSIAKHKSCQGSETKLTMKVMHTRKTTKFKLMTKKEFPIELQSTTKFDKKKSNKNENGKRTKWAIQTIFPETRLDLT